MDMNDIKDTIKAATVSGTTIGVSYIDTVETSLKITLLLVSIIYTIVKILKERK
tara:strand:- start:1232 stop:1393 length:162 start_codon:yes stop_codon:yes gene_type:complete